MSVFSSHLIVLSSSSEEGAGVDQVVHSLDHSAGAPFGFIGADLLEERFSFAPVSFGSSVFN